MNREAISLQLLTRRKFAIGLAACSTACASPNGVPVQEGPTRRVMVSDGVGIAWRELGPKDGPPILFCTMGSSAMAVWDPVARPLADRYRVILHDRRGMGQSDAGSPESHDFDVYRDDAIAVMDAAGVDSAVIVGMAFGARVAMRIARDAKNRTSGLVLFDATGGAAAPAEERLAGNEEAARMREAAGLPTPVRDPRWFQHRDDEAALLNRLALRGHPDWIPGLDQIETPTLVACGEQDPNLAGARRVADEIPGAEFRSMPMTGHASILERPDLVLALLERFLSERV